MMLADLIKGEKTAPRFRSATATVATIATVRPKQADILPSVATVAKVAVATAKENAILAALPCPVKVIPPPPPEVEGCYCCKGQDFWISRINGDAICRRCHPPAHRAELTEYDRKYAALPTITEGDVIEWDF